MATFGGGFGAVVAAGLSALSGPDPITGRPFTRPVPGEGTSRRQEREAREAAFRDALYAKHGWVAERGRRLVRS